MSQYNEELTNVFNQVKHLSVSHKTLVRQYTTLQKDYDELYQLVLTLLDSIEDKELTIHSSRLLKIREEWRIDRRFDEKTEELTFKMLTLRD